MQDLYDVLRAEILNGDLPPGAVISQVKLAERFGVNRAPVREALRMLQREGLINSEHNRRVRIGSLSSADMEQIYAVRIVQEAVALRLSAPQLAAEEYDRLRELLTSMDQHSDISEFQTWETFHEEFHFILISHAGDRIRSALVDLMAYTTRYRRAFKEIHRDVACAAKQHAVIVQACEDGDFVEASDVLARHLARTALGLISATDPTYDPVSVRESLRMVTRA
jgi:DNA-binding GntR family transcriptional regulator